MSVTETLAGVGVFYFILVARAQFFFFLFFYVKKALICVPHSAVLIVGNKGAVEAKLPPAHLKHAERLVQ